MSKKIVEFCVFILLTFSFISNLQAQNELWGMVGADADSANVLGPGFIYKTDSVGRNFKIMHRFKFNDSLNPARPVGRLFLASNGKLYGATVQGGLLLSGGGQTGTIFEYNPATEKLQILVRFGVPQFPSADFSHGLFIEPKRGVLYATSQVTIFTFNILSDSAKLVRRFPILPFGFSGYQNGTSGGLMVAKNGRMYGTTFYGTSVPNCQPTNGSIFSLDTLTNAYSTRFGYPCLDTLGINPISGMVEVGTGLLYGINTFGAAFNGGSIFTFNYLTNSYNKIFSFPSGMIGSAFGNPLMLASNQKLYGLANGGADAYNQSNGVLYEFDPVVKSMSVKHNFGYNNSSCCPLPVFSGNNPIGALIQGITGNLYGANQNGVFEYNVLSDTLIFTHPYSIFPSGISGGLTSFCRKPSYKDSVPDTVRICTGDAFRFTIRSENARQFQWIANGLPLQGQTDSSLVFTNLDVNQSGYYTCSMRNFCGETISNGFYLKVVPSVLPSAVLTDLGSADTLCTYSKLSVKSAFVNPGINPIFKWVVNSDTLVNSEDSLTIQNPTSDTLQVRLILESQAECAFPKTVSSNVLRYVVVKNELQLGSDTGLCQFSENYVIPYSTQGNLSWLANSVPGFANGGFQPHTPGVFSILGQSIRSGCLANDSIQITVYEKPTCQIQFLSGVLQATGASAYQWFFSNTSLPNATDSSHSPNQNGAYFAIGINEQGCSDTSNIVLVTSANQILAHGGIQIFPNPAKNKLAIRLSDEAVNEAMLEIRDLAGRRMYQGKILFSDHLLVFDLKPLNLAPAVYQLQLTTKTGRQVLRLLKTE